MTLRQRQILGLILSLLVVFSFLTPQMQSYYRLQEKQRMTVGDSLNLVLRFPPSLLKTINVYVQEGERLLSMDGNNLNQARYSLGVNSPVAVKPGRVTLQLKLFGVIPLKQINVDVLPEIQLVPGGHSIGVLLRTDGVMVVGYSPVLNENNEPLFPAKDADIAIGDVITEINGTKVLTDDQVKNIISSLGNSRFEMTVKRNGRQYVKYITPLYCNDTKSYRIGLFVRDNAGGVGTLTFYEPKSKKYGALGHVIADAETNQSLKIRQGKILCASIEDVQKAKRGIPGEKVGIFIEDSDLGSIEKNETCGIYGQINNEINNSIYKSPLPIAYYGNIHAGEAQILTVLNGQEIKQYNIIIERINNVYGRLDGKNMIIRITDQELLEKTGGIIQGMSGSPIIQDGKIIGAVTHVFVNDPTRGYGVFIENMLLEAGLLQRENKTLGFSSQGFIFLKNFLF